MSNSRQKKLQYLLISQLMKDGSVELVLPSGIKVEIGITQEDDKGSLQKTDDYCYVVAKKDAKRTMIDSYNLGLQFESEDNTIVYEDEVLDNDGKCIRRMEVI
jgi:hypothetical protein